MTHEAQLEELRTHITNRLAQVKRAEAQIQDLEDRLFELSGVVKAVHTNMPLASLADIKFSREDRFADLEHRVEALERRAVERRTFWQSITNWVKSLYANTTW